MNLVPQGPSNPTARHHIPAWISQMVLALSFERTQALQAHLWVSFPYTRVQMKDPGMVFNSSSGQQLSTPHLCVFSALTNTRHLGMLTTIAPKPTTAITGERLDGILSFVKTLHLSSFSSHNSTGRARLVLSSFNRGAKGK